MYAINHLKSVRFVIFNPSEAKWWVLRTSKLVITDKAFYMPTTRSQELNLHLENDRKTGVYRTKTRRSSYLW